MPDVPDDVHDWMWWEKTKQWVGDKAREVARGYAGNPGTPYGEAMNRVMAAGRSVLPGGGSYADELQNVKEAREEEYPGAYSVVKPLRQKALKQSIADDLTGAAMGMAGSLPKSVKSANLRSWLGASRVVDKGRKPRVMYHGGPDRIDAFDFSHAGSNTGTRDAERAFFFTADRGLADWYAETGAGQGVRYAANGAINPGVVTDAHLRVERPLVLDNPKNSSVRGDLYEELIGSNSRAVEYAEENGFDGVIWPNGNTTDPGYTVAVFSPEQIKSASENRGTFDPRDPDIRHATFSGAGGGPMDEGERFRALADYFAAKTKKPTE